MKSIDQKMREMIAATDRAGDSIEKFTLNSQEYDELRGISAFFSNAAVGGGFIGTIYGIPIFVEEDDG